MILQIYILNYKKYLIRVFDNVDDILEIYQTNPSDST